MPTSGAAYARRQRRARAGDKAVDWAANDPDKLVLPHRRAFTNRLVEGVMTRAHVARPCVSVSAGGEVCFGWPCHDVVVEVDEDGDVMLHEVRRGINIRVIGHESQRPAVMITIVAAAACADSVK